MAICLNQAFAPFEMAIAHFFLPALLNSTVEEAIKLRPLIALPVRHGGLGILDPTTTNNDCFSASTDTTSLLSALLIHSTTFCALKHQRTATTGRGQTAKQHLRETHEANLATILASVTTLDKRRI